MSRIDFAGRTTERAAPPLTDEPMAQTLAFMPAAEIERLVAQAMRSSQSCRGGLVLRGPLRVSAFSQVFRAEGGEIPHAMVVKQFVRDQLGGSAAEAATRYFSSLSKISALAHDAGMGASEPVLLLERYGIVVASWIEGPALSEWLLQVPFRERNAMLGRAGAWLARLHRSTGFEYRVPDIAQAIARLESALSESSARSSRLMQGALHTLCHSAQDIEARPVPWSSSHGDFKPANLIVDNNQLVGIDLDLAIQAPIVNDAAHFLNNLQHQFYTWRGLPRWSEVGQLTRSFAEGYACTAGEELGATFLAWRRLYNAVYLGLSYRSWSRPGRAWLVGLILRYQLKELRNALMRQARRP